MRSIAFLPASELATACRTVLFAGCSNDISDAVSLVTRNLRLDISLTSAVFSLSSVVPEMVTSGFPDRGSGDGEAHASNPPASPATTSTRKWQSPDMVNRGFTRKWPASRSHNLTIPAPLSNPTFATGLAAKPRALRQGRMLISRMDPKKLLFWWFSRGWRGPGALALVILALWLYSLWVY